MKSLAATALVISAAIVFAGCSWLGKGKEVADAYAATSKAKSLAFDASLVISAPRKGKQRAERYQLDSRGAIDQTDPAHPKSRVSTVVDGTRTVVVQPGNGKVYMRSGKDYSIMKLPRKQAGLALVDQATSTTINDALSASVVNFRDALAVTDATGAPTPAISADVSRRQLCGLTLRISMRALSRGKILGEQLLDPMSPRELRLLSRGCNKVLASPPLLTFGIANGYMTVLLAELRVRAQRRIVTIRAEFRFSGIDQPQTGFDPPSRAGTKTVGLVSSARVRSALRGERPVTARFLPVDLLREGARD